MTTHAKRHAGALTDSFVSKKQRPDDGMCHLTAELHANGFVVVSGDTTSVKDYLLKHLGFEFTRGTQTWMHKGGRAVLERLVARVDRRFCLLDVVDHQAPLPKASLSAAMMDSQSSQGDDLDEPVGSLCSAATVPGGPGTANALLQPAAPVDYDDGISDAAMAAALDAAAVPTPEQLERGRANKAVAQAKLAAKASSARVHATVIEDELSDAAMLAALEAAERGHDEAAAAGGDCP